MRSFDPRCSAHFAVVPRRKAQITECRRVGTLYSVSTYETARGYTNEACGYQVNAHDRYM